MNVGQIELDRRIERERDAIFDAVDRNRNELRQRERVARKRRLHADAHAHRRKRALLADAQLLARLLLGVARAPGEFLDDFLRQSRWQADPAFGQQIDEQLLARRHRIDGDLAVEREADAGAVGIAPRRADVLACGHRYPVNENLDRLLELNDEDPVRQPHVGFGLFGKREDETRVAVRRRDADFGRYRGGAGRRGVEQQHGGDQKELHDRKDRDDAHAKARLHLGVGRLPQGPECDRLARHLYSPRVIIRSRRARGSSLVGGV